LSTNNHKDQEYRNRELPCDAVGSNHNVELPPVGGEKRKRKSLNFLSEPTYHVDFDK